MNFFNGAALIYHLKNLKLCYFYVTLKVLDFITAKASTLLRSLTELMVHFLNPSFILLTFQPLLIPRVFLSHITRTSQ